jgi:hypothetical protein
MTKAKRYNKEAEESEEGEIRAVILQKMQNSVQIARTGEEIITLKEAQREVERWRKLPNAW